MAYISDGLLRPTMAFVFHRNAYGRIILLVEKGESSLMFNDMGESNFKKHYNKLCNVYKSMMSLLSNFLARISVDFYMLEVK